MRGFTFREKTLLGVLAALQFSHIVDFMILMPLGPQLMRLFEISPQKFGWLVSIYTATAAVSSLVTAMLIDRFSRRSAIFFFGMGFVVSTLGCALAEEYEWLFLARALAGAFGGVIGTVVLAVVSDAIEYSRRGAAMGVMMGSFSLASIFGIPMALMISNKWGWHAPFVILGVLSFALTLLSLKVVPQSGGLAVRRSLLEPFKSVLRSPSQQSALLFMFVLILGQFSIIPFVSPTLVANAGLTEAQLPLIYLVGGACSIVAAPWIGQLADQHGKHKVFVWGCLFSLLPIVLITQMERASLIWILFTAGALFVGMSGRMVPAMAMVSEVAPPETRASFMSLNASTQQVAQSMGSLIAGWMILRSEGGQILRYDWVGLFAIAASLLALLLSRRLARK